MPAAAAVVGFDVDELADELLAVPVDDEPVADPVDDESVAVPVSEELDALPDELETVPSAHSTL